MSRAEAMRVFVRPLPMAAVLLMAVNDLWLKPAFRNALTGKLSDLAICFFLPLFLAALLGLVVPRGERVRVAIGAAVTVLLFAALKLSPAFAELFEQTLAALVRPVARRSFRAVVDPTDLVALPAAALAVLYARRPVGPDPLPPCPGGLS